MVWAYHYAAVRSPRNHCRVSFNADNYTTTATVPLALVTKDNPSLFPPSSMKQPDTDDKYVTMLDLAFPDDPVHLTEAAIPGYAAHAALHEAGLPEYPVPQTWKAMLKCPEREQYLAAALKEFCALLRSGTFRKVNRSSEQYKF